MSASAAGRRMRIARSTAVRWASIWRKEGRAERSRPPPSGGARGGVGPSVVGGWRRRPIFSSTRSWRGWRPKASKVRSGRARWRHESRAKKTVVAAEQSREDTPSPCRVARRDARPRPGKADLSTKAGLIPMPRAGDPPVARPALGPSRTAAGVTTRSSPDYGPTAVLMRAPWTATRSVPGWTVSRTDVEGG